MSKVKKAKPEDKDVCKECGDKIVVLINRGTGYCSVDCKKGRPKGWVMRGAQGGVR